MLIKGSIKRSPLDHVKLLKLIVKYSNNKKISYLDQDGTFVRPRKNQDFFLEKVNFLNFEQTCHIKVVEDTGGLVFPFWVLFFVYPSKLDPNEVLLCAALLYVRSKTVVEIDPKNIFSEFLPEIDPGYYSLCNLRYPISKDSLL